MRPVIKLDSLNGRRFKKFFSIYEEQHGADTRVTSKTIVTDSVERCRFCKRTKPEVIFKKEAHILPQAIGNRYLLSNFECDSCNSFFGETYENSFASFFSLSKVFAKPLNGSHLAVVIPM